MSKKSRQEENPPKQEYSGKIVGLRASQKDGSVEFDLALKGQAQKSFTMGTTPTASMIAVIVAAQVTGCKIHVSLDSKNGHSTMEQAIHVSSLRIGAKPKPPKSSDADKPNPEEKKPALPEAQAAEA